MEDAEELARGKAKCRTQQECRARWEQELRDVGELPPLTAEEEERVGRGGESVREVSWIWRGAGTTDAETDLEEALRIKWCKAYARSRRWEEEVRLVEEEVHCIGVALEYRACEWEACARGGVLAPWSYERAEGAVAYGLKQAAMYRDIARRVTVSMTEVIRGRGQRRRMVNDDEWVGVGTDGGAQAAGDNDLELQLEDLRADTVTDDDFILGGGADED
ncbi:hypothetical protein B0H14DRAFT_3536655 [Mycena olivaceomarginata]|nr:hypothetical protein B0H14DRAFT_3536655 [Mycena olivaceomarginata]